MKEKKIVMELVRLRNSHIELLDKKKGVNCTGMLVSDYSSLMHMIADLLKTSIKALEGMQAHPQSNQMETEYNIADVINIAVKLLPYNEMLFIDETLSLLDKATSEEK